MRKIKVIHSYDCLEIQENIDNWVKENPNYYIISVNGTQSTGTGGGKTYITYILYEENSERSLLS